MKKRILFVDDEPLALQGLQRMLRSVRGEWELCFAESGAQGLALISQNSFDVVVSDMLMPGMNGAQFLLEVRQRDPKAIRLVLSGHAQKDLVLQATGAAHQYLAKPCPAEVLKSALVRLSALRSSLANESVREIVSQIDRVPTVPALYDQLKRQLQNPAATVDGIAEIVTQDPGLTAKFLKLVNSAFFGFYGSVSNPGRALACLGLETIKSLIGAANAFSEIEPELFRGRSLDVWWMHSLETAYGARRIALAENVSETIADDAFTGGLLHDIGTFVLVSHFGRQYSNVVQQASEQNIDITALERDLFGASHDDVGAYLAGLWGLPSAIVDAIAFHHRPSRSASNGFSALTAVHVANALSHENTNESNGFGRTLVDSDYLEGLGLTERLSAWRDAVQGSLAPNSQ